MSKIKIKNFGPIKDGFGGDGFMDIKKVTLFIGNQGSGKSTVAKLISTFSWIEKALNRGDFKIEKAKDILDRISWHSMEDYFQDNTVLEYIGDEYSISYWAQDNKFRANKTTGPFTDRNHYVVPKIIYVPAERNFLSTIKEVFDLSGLPAPLADFSLELRKSQLSINGDKLQLPINNVEYEFNKHQGLSYISGEGYKINLFNASSGFHSLVPMYLVSRYLVLKIEKETFPEMADVSPNNRIKRDAEISAIWADSSKLNKNAEIDWIFARYHNKCLINIVEEPELNLFPTSQYSVLNSLLDYNNMFKGSKLIMTTHSPYLINYLTLAIEADNLLKKAEGNKDSDSFKKKIDKIVPLRSTVSSDEVAIFELDEKEGKISLLDNYKGIPSDENKLNNELGDGNDLFVELIEIGKELRI